MPSVPRNALGWKVVWLGVGPVRHASFARPGAVWGMSLPTKIGGFVADLPGVHDHASGEGAPMASVRAACLAFPQVAMRAGSHRLRPMPWLVQTGLSLVAHTRRICYAKAEFRRK